MKPIDIKIERIQCGVWQYRLAAALDIPPTTLSKIENGQRIVSQERLEQIVQTIRDLAERPGSEVPNAA